MVLLFLSLLIFKKNVYHFAEPSVHAKTKNVEAIKGQIATLTFHVRNIGPHMVRIC